MAEARSAEFSAVPPSLQHASNDMPSFCEKVRWWLSRSSRRLLRAERGSDNGSITTSRKGPDRPARPCTPKKAQVLEYIDSAEEMSSRPRRRSSVGGHLAALAGAKHGADDGPIGDEVEGSAGAALDPEPREDASKRPTVTVVAPELDAELRGGLQLGGETVATADSSYMLDQGDGNGMTKHFDDVHRVRLCRNILGAASGAIAEQSSLFSDCPHTFVTACGSNEFGPFVSLGCFFAQELMLARRYLAAQDARAAWTVLDLEAAAAGSQFDPAAPWSHKLLHSRKMSRRDAQELLARAGAASPVEGGSGRRRKMQKTSGGTVDHSVIASTALVGVSEARLQRDAIGRLVVEDGLMRFGRDHH